MRTKRRLGQLSWMGLCALVVWMAGIAPTLAANEPAGLENNGCLACHDGKAHKLEMPGADGKPRTLMGVAPDAYGKSVHAKMACVACHTGVTDNPATGAGHKTESGKTLASVGCADCHRKLWDAAKADGKADAKARLGKVVDNANAYDKSFHARPHKTDKTRVNATCDGCHDTHSFNIPTKDSPTHDDWRLGSASMCGDKCHSDELDEYKDSIHGKEAIGKHNKKAAVCSDCHTAHDIGNTSAANVKLAITASCGSCHAENYKSYKATYHGQVSTLGYANTAKCFDCHGSHGILAAKDPASKVHPDNRMDTCKTCHNGKKDIAAAPAGFATFQPHGTTDNFARYPQMWIGYQIMVQLLVGTFGFFWLHTALWFYREWKDRQQAKLRPHIKVEALPPAQQGKHFKRFGAIWRLAHITFAVSLMILTLTGMPLFYPDAAWAPWVMKALGGPKPAGLIHRVFAVAFAGVFFLHLVYIVVRIWKMRDTFKIFGPNSLVPNLQDGKDMIAMFKWFFGKGPRPVFEHWTYWEKFDYWAPFWGVTIIGVSGLMMWIPHITGAYLPGWVFNVAAIFHGEEAFLAVVFLFTVHFFNNHFRPDKFPVEIVMFTGTMSLEHYKHEHRVEYDRLVKSGELEKFLVDAPSAPMTTASKALAFVLIAIGLTLLFGVAVGFFSGG